MDLLHENESTTLTTKKAVEFLLDDTLRLKVCRYCLKVCSNLSELDEILEIGIESGLHEVTIQDMMACFYPFKVQTNGCFPNKICEECLSSAMKAYLFTQQCERAERAIRNCFEDVQEKYDKLDSIEPVKKRGKRKLNPNTNIIRVENDKVLDYAKPVINIVNNNSVLVHNVEMSTLECQKCWQIQPSPQALVVHEESHPKNMWFNCKACGKSFVKRFHLKQHIKKTHKIETIEEAHPDPFNCMECGENNYNLGKHYQHIEKHRFKIMLQNIIHGKTGRLCVACFEDGTKMTDLNEIIDMYGGYPELNGEFKIRDILTSAFLNIPFINIGKSVCETCLTHILNSYIFNCKLEHVKNRLNKCITQLTNSLYSVKDTKRTMMIEISNSVILPMVNFDAHLDTDPRIEVLEDEFREDDEEFSAQEQTEAETNTLMDEREVQSDTSYESENEYRLKKVTKTYSRKNLVNGYKRLNNINEFLTFKPKVECNRNTAKCYFTCPICNKLFVSKYFLKKHILKHNHEVSHCDKCLTEFKSRFDLFEHTKMVHVLNKYNYFSCQVCSRSYTSISKMRQHQISHIKKECHLCNKYFKGHSHFIAHIQRHIARYTLSSKSYHTCSFCEKVYPNKNELSLHVNKLHIQMKPYNCDMCEKSYYTEYNLKSHKKLHSLYSKENCNFCNKTFKSRKSLVIHVRKHIGMKPHQCRICTEKYYSECAMRRHMKNVHGGTCVCSVCKAVFKSVNSLRLHISVAHCSM